MAGGLYDQNPILVERFHYIMVEQSKAEAAKQKKREAESGPTNRVKPSRGPGRRR